MPYLRRRRRRRGSLLSTGVALVLAATFLLGLAIGIRKIHPSRVVRRIAGITSAASKPVDVRLPEGRPVYPFSVVRGGVYTPTELRLAQRSDPVVARHYADLKTADLRMVESASTQAVYVSYRMGDSIYWTRHPVQLKRGELLLTDGAGYVKAKCGNRVSPQPQQPVARKEPPNGTLDRQMQLGQIPAPDDPALPDPPVPGPMPPLVARLAGSIPTAPEIPPEIPKIAATLPPVPMPGVTIQAVPIPPASGPGVTTQGASIPPASGPQIPVMLQAPEPGTWVLMALGLGGLLWGKRLRGRKKADVDVGRRPGGLPHKN